MLAFTAYMFLIKLSVGMHAKILGVFVESDRLDRQQFTVRVVNVM